jgi:hypothetical protein
VEANRAEFAGDVDDLGLSRGLKQRQHGLCQRDRSQEIGLHGFLEHPQVDLAGWAVGLTGDGGVVDEEIEFAELGADGFGCGRRGFRRVEIEVDELAVETLGLEHCGGLLAEFGVAGGGQDGPAGFGDLAGDFEADALVGSGDEGYFLCLLHGFSGARLYGARQQLVCGLGCGEDVLGGGGAFD